MLDKPAPDFDLAAVPGLDQPGLATADPAGGGVVMVNFFASWCVPCRAEHPFLSEIGRASCRERVCQYVYISVVAVSLKKKTQKQHIIINIQSQKTSPACN